MTHDMTIFTMRHGAGLEPVDAEDVRFMDGLIMLRGMAKCILPVSTAAWWKWMTG